ncbi:MAG: hypothetical protein AAF268_10270 [Cyanobacteria bacterium P01_A01_bin.3]
MPSHYEDLCSHLNADELTEWNFICFCIEKNYSREVSLRVNPLRSDALCADFEHRFDLAALLRDLAQQIATTLEREKSATVTTEFQGFLAKLRDRERAEAIERLQAELLHLECLNDEVDGI